MSFMEEAKYALGDASKSSNDSEQIMGYFCLVTVSLKKTVSSRKIEQYFIDLRNLSQRYLLMVASFL